MSFPYPNQRYTTNLGLSLFGMDEVLADNMNLLDQAYGAGSSVNVNGTLVPEPNFNGTLPAAPAGKTNVLWQFDNNGNVSAYVDTSGGGAVSSVFGRAGVVVAVSGDYSVAQITGAAPLASPTFTGNPLAPTPTTADNSTSIATTAFVKAQGYITASAVTSVFGRAGVVVAVSGDYSVGQITGAAPLASPTFTGNPLAPTPLTADNSTSIATTAFVKAQGYITSSPVTSVFGRVGAVVAAANDYESVPNLSLGDGNQGIDFLSDSTLHINATKALVLITDGFASLQLGDSAGHGNFLLSSGGSASIQTDTAGNTITIAATALTASVAVNSTVGYRIGGVAASGNYLRGNGTNFVASTIQAGDINTLIKWSDLQNATAPLTLANAGNATTFNQTSAVNWSWANTTASTLGTGQASPLLNIKGTSFSSAAGVLAASVADAWSIQNVVANGATISGTGQITNIAETAGSVVTLTLSSPSTTPIAGQVWEISGMGVGKGDWLNGYSVSLITATASTCTFNDPTAHGLLASTGTTGSPLMTQVSGISSLVFTHSGSPNTGTTALASTSAGTSVAFPNTNSLLVGTASSITGGIGLAAAGSSAVVMAYGTGNGWQFVGSGAVTLTSSGGFNLAGSSSTQLSLSNGSVITTGAGFTIQGVPTSNVYATTVINTTAALSGQSQSTSLILRGKYWTGAASANDDWTIGSVLANGTNGTSVLTVSHSGTSGASTLSIPSISSYNGIATVSNGIPSEVATVDLTGQTAAITATTLYTPTASGMFRISAYLKITTTGTSPVMGPLTIAFTDATDSVAQSFVMQMATQAGASATSNSGNSTTSALNGEMIIWAKTGVAITYAVALTGTVGTAAYEVHLKCEAM